MNHASLAASLYFVRFLFQLDIAKSVIENTKQPHEFLVRSIQSKETQLRKQQASIEIMQKKIE